MDGITQEKDDGQEFQCFPLFSLLLALDSPTVTLLSLDIEGAELAVLRAIPWTKVNIELVMIEVNHSDQREIHSVMTTAGYGVYKRLGGQQDIIYRKL